MQKDRIESIYFLRLFAMLMVVLVHTTGIFQSVFSEGSMEFGVYHFINRIIRLEAGIFIMITAMVFFYKYIDKKMTVPELKDYYKKRALYIVVPYLLWALFYEAFSLYIGAVPLNFAEMTWRIIQGESFYQLHFIFLIVQFYLVFPIILFVAQKVPVFKKYMWVFGIAIEIGYYFFDQTFKLIPFSIFLSSLGPYLLGAWIGTYYKEQRSLIYRKTNVAWAVFALAAGVTTVFLHYHLYTVSTFVLPGYVYLIMNLSYILSGSYILFRLTEVVCDKWPAIIPYVQRVAVYSFGFYLLHPFILKLVAQFIPAPEGYWFHLFILLRYVSTIVLCYLVIWFTHKYFVRPGLLFGKLPRRAPSILETPKVSTENKRTGT